jgi:hypothetical protein
MVVCATDVIDIEAQKGVLSQMQCIAPIQQCRLESNAKPAAPFHHHNAMI